VKALLDENPDYALRKLLEPSAIQWGAVTLCDDQSSLSRREDAFKDLGRLHEGLFGRARGEK